MAGESPGGMYPASRAFLSLLQLHLPYSRKTLHQSSKSFVEHALHVAREQFRTQA